MHFGKNQTNQSQKYLVCWCDRYKKSALVMHFGKLQTIKAKNTLYSDVKDPAINCDIKVNLSNAFGEKNPIVLIKTWLA